MIRTRMRIKEGVERGLCGSCGNAQSRTFENGASQVFCNEIYNGTDKVVRRPVVECSEYIQKNTASKYEMEQVAWVLEVKGGKTIGFVNPLDAEKKGLRRRTW